MGSEILNEGSSEELCESWSALRSSTERESLRKESEGKYSVWLIGSMSLSGND